MTRNISVALASCNGAAYIGAQIESILSQQVKPDEIIITDDCSTDGTIGVLSPYVDKGLVKLFQNEHRIGIIDNFKKAAGLCKHDNYVALCDQDDYWLPDKLKENIAAIKSIEVDALPAIAFSDLSLVDEHLKIIHDSFWEVLNIKPERERLSSLLFGNFITGCTIIMNMEMRKHFCAMPVEDVSMHDAWLGLIAFTFGRYSIINKPLVLYRQHGKNVTYETNRKGGLALKLSQIFKQVLNNSGYLIKEIKMAKKFSLTYGDRLSPGQIDVLSKFVSLENAAFMRKKISSIRSRSYRLSSRF